MCEAKSPLCLQESGTLLINLVILDFSFFILEHINNLLQPLLHICCIFYKCLYMYMYVLCGYIFVYVCTCIYLRRAVCSSLCFFVCMYEFVCIYMCLCVYVCVGVYLCSSMCVCIYVLTYLALLRLPLNSIDLKDFLLDLFKSIF